MYKSTLLGPDTPQPVVTTSRPVTTTFRQSTTTPPNLLIGPVNPSEQNTNGDRIPFTTGKDTSKDTADYYDNMEDYYDDIIDYVFELPDRGIADKFISDFYSEEDRNSDSGSDELSRSRQRQKIRIPAPRPILTPQDLDDKLRPTDVRPNPLNLNSFPSALRRAANIPNSELNPGDDLAVGGSEIREVVDSLKDLIQLLNSTDQGRNRLKRIKQKLFPIKNQHNKHAMMNMYNPSRQKTKSKPNRVVDILLDDLQVLALAADNKPKTNVNLVQDLKLPTGGTIPPHLIPLGPDGNPLINPDGSLIKTSDYNMYKNKLTELFPYLDSNTTTLIRNVNDQNTTTTTEAVVIEDDEESSDKDPITAMIDTIHDLPMETRQHMMANMMFAIPMAALSMVAAGVPQLAIAPLALVIPGFFFAAFTETGDGTAATRNGHGHHGHHGHHGQEGDAASDDHHNRHGISGLIAGVRDFYQNGLDTDTLHINTRPRTKRSIDTKKSLNLKDSRNIYLRGDKYLDFELNKFLTYLITKFKAFIESKQINENLLL